MLHRLVLFCALLLVITFGILQLQPVKRELYYRLNISGDNTMSCCDEKEIAKSTGDFDEDANFALYNGEIVEYPKTSLAYDAQPASEKDSDVLGTTNAAGEEKWIEVSLDQQKVRAWEGNQIVMEFPISSGKWYPTPKGDYTIWYKTRSQLMKGGSKELGTYYYLPNVPYNMFFYKGYALHGAYWHNNFGQPMSHGCVNEPIPNAKEIFDWAGPVVPEGKNAVRASAENPGTRVFIH